MMVRAFARRCCTAIALAGMVMGLSGCVLLTTPSAPEAVAALRARRAAARIDATAAVPQLPRTTPAPARVRRAPTAESPVAGAVPPAYAVPVAPSIAPAVGDADRARLAAQLVNDPTDLATAEQLGLLDLAAALPDGVDLASATSDFRAMQDVLRAGLSSDPASAGLPENRWAAARRASIDPDARQLFTMTYRDQWLLSWAPSAPDHIISAIEPYYRAVIARAMRDHIARLRDLVTRIGWFDIRRYGETASHAAWLIVQHADFDTDYQRTMLDHLRPRVASGDFQPRFFGFLTDRVAVNAGEPQTYGTQGRCVAVADGVSIWQPFDMIDPATVDERRLSVGLDPLSVYRAEFSCDAAEDG